MGRWTVERSGRLWVVENVRGAQASLDIVPPGEPFIADIASLEDIRGKIGAAVVVARGDAATAGQQDGPDVVALAILLNRVTETISGTLVRLTESQANSSEFPAVRVLGLANELEWVSRVLRTAAGPAVPPSGAEPGTGAES